MPDEAAPFSRPGTLDNLPAFVDFVREACERAGADASSCFALRLAVEEVCTNLMRHGYAGRDPGPIEVRFRAEPRRLVVTITDFAPPFFPEKTHEPDLTSGWKERPLGGLGWHLVKNVVDQVRYETGGIAGNRLTLVKNTEPKFPLKEELHGNHGPRIGSGDDHHDPREH